MENEHKKEVMIIDDEEKAKLILKDAAVISDEKIKQFLLQAIQSGKRETSGLVDEIMKKMDHKIEESINKNVNGKITNLSKKLDDHIVRVEDYIKTDNEWKDTVQPIRKIWVDYTLFGSIALKIGRSIRNILLFIVSVGGAIILISKWLE